MTITIHSENGTQTPATTIYINLSFFYKKFKLYQA